MYGINKRTRIKAAVFEIIAHDELRKYAAFDFTFVVIPAVERCRAQRGRLAGFYAYEVAEHKITVILLNLLQKRFKKCRRYGVIGIDKADECPACRQADPRFAHC